MRSAQLTEPPSSRLDELDEVDARFVFEMGERELKTASLSTNEETARAWKVIQHQRLKRQSATIETQRKFAVPDDTPLGQTTSQVVIGQWEPGLILHACPTTKGQTFLRLLGEPIRGCYSYLRGRWWC